MWHRSGKLAPISPLLLLLQCTQATVNKAKNFTTYVFGTKKLVLVLKNWYRKTGTGTGTEKLVPVLENWY